MAVVKVLPLWLVKMCDRLGLIRLFSPFFAANKLGTLKQVVKVLAVIWLLTILFLIVYTNRLCNIISGINEKSRLKAIIDEHLVYLFILQVSAVMHFSPLSMITTKMVRKMEFKKTHLITRAQNK